ncbi:TadE/TadG family type IV pilus assembly protein [Actinospongicola halichondriae]|uniref:TadE/TadG family type IV pilus assembly protein n=1 Tax=Actinospongicola halichondriae TaxID=3236844 RepID=UPI003D370F8F
MRRPGGERGASILELALITPVMALIVMGVLDLARGHQMQIGLTNAAREGAAYAQIAPNDVSCAGEDDIIDRVMGESGDLAGYAGLSVVVFAEDASGDLTVPVTGCGGSTASSGERVRVEVTATFDVITPMVERVVGGSIDLTGSSEIEVQS